VPLGNWGPLTLRRTTARIHIGNAGVPYQRLVRATLSSPDAYPTQKSLAFGVLTFGRYTPWSVEYVPGSAVVRGSGAAVQRIVGNPVTGAVPIAGIPASANSKGGLQLEVRVRARSSP
jgi:hypothetical protein